MFSFTCRQPTKEALHEVTKGTFSDMNRNFSVNPPEKKYELLKLNDMR